MSTVKTLTLKKREKAAVEQANQPHHQYGGSVSHNPELEKLGIEKGIQMIRVVTTDYTDSLRSAILMQGNVLALKLCTALCLLTRKSTKET